MKWAADRYKREAMSDCGYRIAWSTAPHGTYFNAYAPNGKHIDASYDGEKMKAACEAHRRLQNASTTGATS